MTKKSSLLFVNSVNFELTYKCAYNCCHCLQKNIKKQPVVELSTDEVKTAIFHSQAGGLCSRESILQVAKSWAIGMIFLKYYNILNRLASNIA